MPSDGMPAPTGRAIQANRENYGSKHKRTHGLAGGPAGPWSWRRSCVHIPSHTHSAQLELWHEGSSAETLFLQTTKVLLLSSQAMVLALIVVTVAGQSGLVTALPPSVHQRMYLPVLVSKTPSS